MRLLEATTYDDLESEEATPATQLSLSRVERYLNGPTAAASSASSSASSASHNGNGHAAPNAGAVRDAVLRWAGARAMDVVDSDTAAGVLGSLSPGGAMMRGAHHANATRTATYLFSTIPFLNPHFRKRRSYPPPSESSKRDSAVWKIKKNASPSFHDRSVMERLKKKGKSLHSKRSVGPSR